MADIQLQPVESSCVAAVGYDPTQHLLVVVFHKTGTYTYFNVSEDMYHDFVTAPSLGVYVNKVFKQSNWPYQRGLIPAAMNTAPLE
jgi:KTSC domain-containing protein